jgi:hypothetical protein
VERLGEKAEVIILRDAGIRLVARPKTTLDATPQRAATGADILQSLEAERGLVAAEQVRRNIESLKPLGASVLKESEFQKLEKALVEGFSFEQLSGYFHNFDKESGAAPHDMQSSTDGQRSLEATDPIVNGAQAPTIAETEWMPGVSATTSKPEQSVLRGYAGEEFTRKRKLAVLLMRSCWNVESLEVVEGLGEKEVILDTQSLKLLLPAGCKFYSPCRG